MQILSTETNKLLDKLYNLRGEDSVILSKMEKEKKDAEETKERTTKEKENLQERIESLTEEERVLGEEGEKLVSVLKNIKADDFKIVLEKLNVDFNPEKISEEVSELLPKTIEKVQEEKNGAEDSLLKVESEMNMASATIEELSIRKDEALSNQRRLNEYFDLALDGNINITRDAVTSLLAKLDFNEDEQRAAAKLLMFPEDGLYEYEAKIREEKLSGKSISEVFQEAKESVEESGEIINETVEDIKLSPKEELIQLLTELGFDYLDFTTNDIEKILSNYNETDLRKNISFAKEMNIKLDLFIDNVELLYDKEFQSKVEKLLEIGKEALDIYLNPNILIKYNKNDLDNKIDELINSGLDPRMVPLIAY